MRIVSISRRTDIPAFYSRWLLNRIHAGFCHWINPFGGQVYRVSLRPEDCLALVFWTRNPLPLLPHLTDLEKQGFHSYFHFTINGYPESIESHNPPVGKAVEVFRRVSDLVGPSRIHWRYDPLLLSEATPPAYHREQFARLIQQLSGYTQRCYFSFVDFYGKTARNLARVGREHGLTFQNPDPDLRRQLVRELRDLAAPRGVTLYSCCDDALVGQGVEKAHCVDLDMIRRLRPDVDVLLKAAPTREDCGCVETADIGAYDTCSYGCAFCYATNSREAATTRMRQHDPSDTVLWRPATLRGIDLATKEVHPKRTVARPLPSLQGELFQVDSMAHPNDAK